MIDGDNVIDGEFVGSIVVVGVLDGVEVGSSVGDALKNSDGDNVIDGKVVGKALVVSALEGAKVGSVGAILYTMPPYRVKEVPLIYP